LIILKIKRLKAAWYEPYRICVQHFPFQSDVFTNFYICYIISVITSTTIQRAKIIYYRDYFFNENAYCLVEISGGIKGI